SRRTFLKNSSLAALAALFGIRSSARAGEVTNLQLYAMLKEASNTSTGLAISFFNTTDTAMSRQAVTYDQALFGLASLSMAAQDADALIRATNLFNFYYNIYIAQIQSGGVFRGFNNMYNVDNGTVGLDNGKRTGPNAWIGIFSLHYYIRSGDNRGLILARAIYNWIRALPHYRGAVCLGPSLTNSVSNEENFDYYALLQLLLPFMTPAESPTAQQELDNLTNYFHYYAFEPFQQFFYRGVKSIAAGQIDNYRALDTTTFAILAVGAEQLEGWEVSSLQRLSLNRLISGTESRCAVASRGFDVSDLANATVCFRPLLSFWEFTLQMALCYKKVAIFLRKIGNAPLAVVYEEKARQYNDNVDNSTGFAYCEETGRKVWYDIPTWLTISGRSTSVLAWKIFVQSLFNPMEKLAGSLVLDISRSGQMLITRNDPRISQVILQVTEDFVTWSDISTITLSGYQTVVPIVMDRPFKFYRLKEASSPLKPASSIVSSFLCGRSWYDSLAPWRKSALARFFGPRGRMITIPVDHNNPKDHFRHPELTAEEAQLAIFTSMSDYVFSFLIHPESMLGRIEVSSGKFICLKDIAATLKTIPLTEQASYLKEHFGRLQLHPQLPQDKLYVVKWEANSTPNGDIEKVKKDQSWAIGNTPKNQGMELGISLEELRQVPQVIGVKFMTYIDAALHKENPETLNNIVTEVRSQAEEAHRAGLLFFPEDLPAKSMNGVAFEEKGKKTKLGQRKEAIWAAENSLMFAKALAELGVDYDTYKFTFPGILDNYEGTQERIMTEEEVTANLKEMAQHTQGRLMMMLSRGGADTAKKAAIATQYLPIVGFFPGRGVWGKSFWEIQSFERTHPNFNLMLESIRLDLRDGTTRQRYDELEIVLNNMKPFWEHLGVTREEIGQASSSAVSREEVPVAGDYLLALPDQHPLMLLNRMGRKAIKEMSLRLKRSKDPSERKLLAEYLLKSCTGTDKQRRDWYNQLIRAERELFVMEDLTSYIYSDPLRAVKKLEEIGTLGLTQYTEDVFTLVLTLKAIIARETPQNKSEYGDDDIPAILPDIVVNCKELQKFAMRTLRKIATVDFCSSLLRIFSGNLAHPATAQINSCNSHEKLRNILTSADTHIDARNLARIYLSLYDGEEGTGERKVNIDQEALGKIKQISFSILSNLVLSNNALEVLKRIVKENKDVDSRCRAIILIANIGTPEAAQVFVDYLQNISPEEIGNYSYLIEIAMRRFDVVCVEPLCCNLDKLNPVVRTQVIRGLIAIKPPKEKTWILSLVRRNKDVLQRNDITAEERAWCLGLMAALDIEDENLAREISQEILVYMQRLSQLTGKEEKRNLVEETIVPYIQAFAAIGQKTWCAEFLEEMFFSTIDIDIRIAIIKALRSFKGITAFWPMLNMFNRLCVDRLQVETSEDRFSTFRYELAEYILVVFFDQRLREVINEIETALYRQEAVIAPKIKNVLRELSIWERGLVQKHFPENFDEQVWDEIAVTSIFDHNLGIDELLTRMKIFDFIATHSIYPTRSLVRYASIFMPDGFSPQIMADLVNQWTEIIRKMRHYELHFNPTNKLHFMLGFSRYAHARRYALEKSWTDITYNRDYAGEEDLLLYQLYKEYKDDIAQYLKFNAMPLPFFESLNNLIDSLAREEEHLAALRLARYEQYQLLEWLFALKAQADKAGRKVIVVPNVRYGYFLMGSLKNILLANGIEVAYAGVSSQSADDDYSYRHRYYIKPQIFPMNILNTLLGQEGKRPIVVVLDGTREIYNRNVSGKIVRLPMALARTYIDTFICLNAMTSDRNSRDFRKSFAGWRSPEYVDILSRQEGYIKLREKLERALTAKPVIDKQSYRFYHWNAQGLPYLLGRECREWGHGIALLDKDNLRFPLDIAEINGHPAVILVNLAFMPEEAHHLKEDKRVIRAFWDDQPPAEELFVRINERASEVISVLDEKYLPVKFRFLQSFIASGLPVVPYQKFAGYTGMDLRSQSYRVVSTEPLPNTLHEKRVNEEIKELVARLYHELNIPQAFIENMLHYHLHMPRKNVVEESRKVRLVHQIAISWQLKTRAEKDEFVHRVFWNPYRQTHGQLNRITDISEEIVAFRKKNSSWEEVHVCLSGLEAKIRDDWGYPADQYSQANLLFFEFEQNSGGAFEIQRLVEYCGRRNPGCIIYLAERNAEGKFTLVKQASSSVSCRPRPGKTPLNVERLALRISSISGIEQTPVLSEGAITKAVAELHRQGEHDVAATLEYLGRCNQIHAPPKEFVAQHGDLEKIFSDAYGFVYIKNIAGIDRPISLQDIRIFIAPDISAVEHIENLPTVVYEATKTHYLLVLLTQGANLQEAEAKAQIKAEEAEDKSRDLPAHLLQCQPHDRAPDTRTAIVKELKEKVVVEFPQGLPSGLNRIIAEAISRAFTRAFTLTKQREPLKFSRWLGGDAKGKQLTVEFRGDIPAPAIIEKDKIILHWRIVLIPDNFKDDICYINHLVNGIMFVLGIKTWGLVNSGNMQRISYRTVVTRLDNNISTVNSLLFLFSRHVNNGLTAVAALENVLREISERAQREIGEPVEAIAYKAATIIKVRRYIGSIIASACELYSLFGRRTVPMFSKDRSISPFMDYLEENLLTLSPIKAEFFRKLIGLAYLKEIPPDFDVIIARGLRADEFAADIYLHTVSRKRKQAYFDLADLEILAVLYEVLNDTLDAQRILLTFVTEGILHRVKHVTKETGLEDSVAMDENLIKKEAHSLHAEALLHIVDMLRKTGLHLTYKVKGDIVKYLRETARETIHTTYLSAFSSDTHMHIAECYYIKAEKVIREYNRLLADIYCDLGRDHLGYVLAYGQEADKKKAREFLAEKLPDIEFPDNGEAQLVLQARYRKGELSPESCVISKDPDDFEELPPLPALPVQEEETVTFEVDVDRVPEQYRQNIFTREGQTLINLTRKELYQICQELKLMQRYAFGRPNSGLGTRWAVPGYEDKAKGTGIIPIFGGRSFTEIGAAHLLWARRHYGADIPLVQLLSFFTEADIITEYESHDYFGLGCNNCIFYFNDSHRRMREHDGNFIHTGNRKQDFIPQGHFDTIRSLLLSDTLYNLVISGKEILAVSNIDNLVATVEPVLVAMLYLSGKPVLCEVNRKQPNEPVGGSLVFWKEDKVPPGQPRLQLREGPEFGNPKDPNNPFMKLRNQDQQEYNRKFGYNNTANYHFYLPLIPNMFGIEWDELKELHLRYQQVRSTPHDTKAKADLRVKIADLDRRIIGDMGIFAERDRKLPVVQFVRLLGQITQFFPQTLFVEVPAGDRGVFSRFDPHKENIVNINADINRLLAKRQQAGELTEQAVEQIDSNLQMLYCKKEALEDNFRRTEEKLKGMVEFYLPPRSSICGGSSPVTSLPDKNKSSLLEARQEASSRVTSPWLVGPDFPAAPTVSLGMRLKMRIFFEVSFWAGIASLILGIPLFFKILFLSLAGFCAFILAPFIEEFSIYKSAPNTAERNKAVEEWLDRHPLRDRDALVSLRGFIEKHAPSNKFLAILIHAGNNLVFLTVRMLYVFSLGILYLHSETLKKCNSIYLFNIALATAQADVLHRILATSNGSSLRAIGAVVRNKFSQHVYPATGGMGRNFTTRRKRQKPQIQPARMPSSIPTPKRELKPQLQPKLSKPQREPFTLQALLLYGAGILISVFLKVNDIFFSVIRYLQDKRKKSAEAGQRFAVGQFSLSVASTEDEFARITASLVAAKINELQKTLTRDVVIVFASGNTMVGFLTRLSEQPNINWKRIQVFHLDEYSGLSPDNPCSFAYFLQKYLFSKVSLHKKNIHFINGARPNLDVYPRELMQYGGPDIVILGIGINRHIAFNEPYTNFESGMRKVRLSKATILTNKKGYPSIENNPYAFTLGLRDIMRGKTIFLFAKGKDKAEIIAEALRGPVTTKVPASVLQRHPDLRIVIDEKAGERLFVKIGRIQSFISLAERIYNLFKGLFGKLTVYICIAWFALISNTAVSTVDIRDIQEKAFFQPAPVVIPNIQSEEYLAAEMMRLRLWEQAADTFWRIVAVEPDVEKHFHGLGLTSLCCRRFEDAALAYRRVLHFSRKEPDFRIFHNLGIAYLGCRRGPEAFIAFLESTRRGSTNLFDWVMCGEFFLRLNEIDKAKYCFAKAVQIDPRLLKSMKPSYREMVREEFMLMRLKKAAIWLVYIMLLGSAVLVGVIIFNFLKWRNYCSSLQKDDCESLLAQLQGKENGFQPNCLAIEYPEVITDNAPSLFSGSKVYTYPDGRKLRLLSIAALKERLGAKAKEIKIQKVVENIKID
ncbi:MAG: UTP--glucose-1-phosphate uridylyltransferase, partial [Candidatus Omnitrophica bacterium]|nr:UTP--glucose-1-phosphate uridylyltransferase [Candidatus Omnitrophota bacterium]